MYNEFFGFNRAPFNNTPDPDFYFESDGHKEALATMIYGVEQGKGFVMITGDVGMGKTLLNQTLKKELGKTHVFIEISNPWSTPEEVINAIRTSIGIERPDNNALFDGLRERLLELAQQNRRVILVIDEAHQMSERMIEGIRLLSNIETTTEKLLQIIFIGQNEFAEMMGRYSMRQIQQRLFLCHHLEGFTASETEQYVRHRIDIADGAADLFSEEALALIYAESQGIPRVINQLCDNALLFAYGRESKQVSVEDVNDSIGTLRRWQKPLTKANEAITSEQTTPASAKPSSKPLNEVASSDLPEPKIEVARSSESTPLTRSPQATTAEQGSVLPFSLPLPGANVAAEEVPMTAERKNSTFSSLPFNSRTSSPPAPATVTATQGFLNLPHSAGQGHAPVINEHMANLVRHVEYASLKRFLVPIALMALAAGATWFVLQPSAPQALGSAKFPNFGMAETVATPQHTTGEPLNLSMANSINSNDPNKGKASTSGLPMSGAGNATSSLSGLPMPAIMNHRQVAIPKDGGVPRLAAETFGLWNETARDLIYATNPEIISPLNDLQSGTQLRMPVLSRDALIVKTPNGSNQIYYGSFASPEEAQAELQIVRRIWGGSQAQAVSRQGTTVYRVFVGPFPSKTDANTALESMWFKHLPALN